MGQALLVIQSILQKQGIKEGFMTDNDRKNKKKIAVIAAVANYIKTEQEALMASQMASLPPKEPGKDASGAQLMGYRRPAAADADAADDADESVSRRPFENLTKP
ncbi:MAG: hypothetical protein R2861_02880 [Desulfobacterales bacterium]